MDRRSRLYPMTDWLLDLAVGIVWIAALIGVVLGAIAGRAPGLLLALLWLLPMSVVLHVALMTMRAVLHLVDLQSDQLAQQHDQHRALVRVLRDPMPPPPPPASTAAAGLSIAAQDALIAAQFRR